MEGELEDVMKGSPTQGNGDIAEEVDASVHFGELDAFDSLNIGDDQTAGNTQDLAEHADKEWLTHYLSSTSHHVDYPPVNPRQDFQ